MSKHQFWTLNLVGGVCALLILSTIILGQINNQLNSTAVMLSQQFNEAQRVRGTGQNLVSRIARDAAQEPALRDLLARHQSLINSEAPAKSSP